MMEVMADQFLCETSSAFKDYKVNPNQMAALRECINGKLPLQDAVKRLTSHVEASPTPLELFQRLGGLWTLLNETAVKLPTAQPTVISILETIRTLPPIIEPTGEGAEAFDFDDGAIWKKLTGWANNWADNYNSYAARSLIDRPSDASEQRECEDLWANACAYTARLETTGDEYLGAFGAGLERAVHAIPNALEVLRPEPGSFKAAAQLFLFAGDGLLKRCKQRKVEGQLTIANQEQIWRGKDGFTVERWMFWKERWETVARRTDSDGNVAKEVLRAIEKSEKGM